MSEEDAPPAPPHNGNGVGDPPPHVVGDPPPHGVCVADPLFVVILFLAKEMVTCHHQVLQVSASSALC